MNGNEQQVPPSTDPRRARFDRAIGALVGIPGVICTSAATVRALTPMTGDAQTFIVQTYRQRDADDAQAGGDWVFIEHVDDGGAVRLVMPPKVTAESLASATH